MNLIDIGTSSQAIVSEIADIPGTPDEIIYSIGCTSIGQVLVARTPVGICTILVGSDIEALKDDLATRFPDRALISSASQLSDELTTIARFIERPAEGLNLPLDMRHGTPFQRRV